MAEPARKGVEEVLPLLSNIALAELGLRLTHGYTQTDAAERLGVSQKTVSLWRRGLFGEIREDTRDALLTSILTLDPPEAELRRAVRRDESRHRDQALAEHVFERETRALSRPRAAPAGSARTEPEWPDVSTLKPAALAYYRSTIGEWITERGWISEIAAAAANDMTRFLRADATLTSEGPGRPVLTEDEQLLALKAARGAVEAYYDRHGRDSTS